MVLASQALVTLSQYALFHAVMTP